MSEKIADALTKAIDKERRAADLSSYYERTGDTGKKYDKAQKRTDKLIAALRLEGVEQA